MSEKTLNDLNVMNEETLVSPTELKNLIPASEDAFQTVREGRDTIKKILDRSGQVLFEKHYTFFRKHLKVFSKIFTSFFEKTLQKRVKLKTCKVF